MESTTVLDNIKEIQTNKGNNLVVITQQQPVLLVFLRHFGCVFCREALEDISNRREVIEAQGTKIVFVHMSDYATADKYFVRYDLKGVEHISDPDCKYYAAFGLAKGNFNQLFGLSSWMRGFNAGIIKGHGIGSQLGDGFQMPGVFILVDGEIRESFIHKLSSDRPDYEQLVRCCAITG